MAKILEKKERSLGVKLLRKGERANSPKAALLRKPYRPGPQGKKFRRKLSEYGTQLQEKQKIKFSYGVTERQLRNIVKEVEKRVLKQDISATNEIIKTLESRLDNVIMRLGFTEGRSLARQMVSHGHFIVNGKRVKTPSFRVKVGDKISVRSQSRVMPYFEELNDKIKKYEPPTWLKIDKAKLEGEVVGSPEVADALFNVSLVVDYYSK
ncbi:MAG: 30S ribosomal protein S4 [Candidatus Colwellbacteria bacterium CG10_big_fil_rev_8_21_14_0_10_42_22]|uniref:Small ribosomal subunit protein uS4 n=1 Tax=Candidatus Colwellbacteria bacterium CG10_big_fil_rev_8_21_14_0_10_42_22 TaxID=1974540 RepID=A0A2H0VFH8_9BACT|nr:MAG: 30S ribosomal protein S4 [Candidatus Colwellbacteria bacterium CG10_big_fil_rev_8_21_14_0_10_42_22]